MVSCARTQHTRKLSLEATRTRRLRKRLLATEFTMFQNSSLKIHVFQFVNVGEFFLSLNSKGLYLDLKIN